MCVLLKCNYPFSYLVKIATNENSFSARVKKNEREQLLVIE